MSWNVSDERSQTPKRKEKADDHHHHPHSLTLMQVIQLPTFFIFQILSGSYNKSSLRNEYCMTYPRISCPLFRIIPTLTTKEAILAWWSVTAQGGISTEQKPPFCLSSAYVQLHANMKKSFSAFSGQLAPKVGHSLFIKICKRDSFYSKNGLNTKWAEIPVTDMCQHRTGANPQKVEHSRYIRICKWNSFNSMKMCII